MTPKIGIIGVGKFGDMHLKALIQAHNKGTMQLAAIADIDENILEQRQKEYSGCGLKTFADYREMLEKCELDGVTVATPDFLHRQITVDCLNAGKHVLVEKPMDTTVEGCREMLAAAEKNNLLLQVDFHKRYDPYHRELASLARAGKFGRIQYAYAHMEDKIEVPRDWFPHWAPKSSPLWFLGVHMIDLGRWIIGGEAKKVFATGMKDKLVSLGVDAWDSVQTNIIFDNGASFTVQASWIMPDGFEAIVDQSIRIIGSEGMMEVDSQYRGARSCFAGDGMKTHNLGFMTERKDAAGNIVWAGYGIEAIEDFADNVARIMDGGPVNPEGAFRPGARDGLAVAKIAVAACQSLESGNIVEIEPE